MTLEEHINKFKEAFIFCSNEEAEINIAMKGYQIEDLIHYLEELKELRVELERNSKALEVYKRALEIVVTEQEFRESVLETARKGVELQQKERKQE